MGSKSRRPAREAVLRALYQIEVAQIPSEDAIRNTLESGDLPPDMADFVRKAIRGVREHLSEIDDRLAALVEEWDFDRLAPVDRNIMRLSAYELLHEPAIPPAVSINEAVELAKKYSTAESGRFVNGVLGKLLQFTPKARWDPAAAPREFEEEPHSEPAEQEPEVEVVDEESPEAQELARIGLWKIRKEDEGA